MNEDIKFDTNGDMLYEIAMIIYDRHNSNIAAINDHLGEIYSYQDLQNAERCELEDEKHLLELAVKQLQQENRKLKQWDKNKDTRNSRQRVEISRLLKENQQLKENNLEMQKEMARSWEKLRQRDEVIDEILSYGIFEGDCPASISGEELDCCENCQDDYKKCWLKYFKEKNTKEYKNANTTN